MNNSFLSIDEISPEKEPRTEEKIGHLTALIEAIGEIKTSHAWSTLKDHVLGEVERLERLQKQEAEKPELNLPELYRLQGRLAQAKHHSFEALETRWRTELSSFKKQLTPRTSPGIPRDDTEYGK